LHTEEQEEICGEAEEEGKIHLFVYFLIYIREGIDAPRILLIPCCFRLEGVYSRLFQENVR
jgi:hypothetical protein